MAGLIPRLSHPRTKVRTWNPDEEVDLAIGKSRIEAEEPMTVGQLFKSAVQKFPTHNALKYKENGKWKAITYSEYYHHCIKAAKSFLKLGLKPNQVVAILGSNSPEWVISTLGVMFAGGLPAGIYELYNSEDYYFVANNCQANIIVVEKEDQVDKILQIRDRLKLPQLKAIVQYKGKLRKELCSQNYLTKEYCEWNEFLELGNEIETNVVEDKIMSQKPNKCALLIHTPGTTGYPKGVMLSHDNLTFTAKALDLTFGRMMHGQEHGVSYLPLASIAAQMADIYLPLLVGGTVHFAQPDAINGSLIQTLREVKPTFFFGVPRVYEKMMDYLQKSQSLQADAIREKLGFQQCNIFAVGSVPTCRRIHDYFNSIKIPLTEVYGMSECSGPHTLGPIPQIGVHDGSCGTPIMGVKQKIVVDENGHHETWLYGRHVFMGYLNDEEKTNTTKNETLDTRIDSDGWLHSGDIGETKGDFLYITGRKKEIIILSSGDSIHPVPIEMRIKDEIPFICDVMVIGDKRQFLTCLMTLKRDYGNPQDLITPRVQELIKAFGSHNTMVSKSVAEKDPYVFTAISEGIKRVNKQGNSQVQNWTLLKTEFSISGGELGPTLKVKRRAVQEMYKKEIESVYNDLKFQWRKDSKDLHESSKYRGTKTHTLYIKDVEKSDKGSYQCIVKNDVGELSEEASLAVIDPSKITQHPESKSVATGASATFTIKASGDNLQLKWRKGGKDLHEISKYRGTKTHTLYIKDVEKSDKGSYQCIVKNDVGELSEEVDLAVIDTPKITQHPESKSVATGASTTFTIKASGDNLQLKWRKGGKDLHESSKYSGTKTHTLYIKDVEKSDKGSYQCIVKNDVGELSEEVDLAVIDPPKITQHPESKSVATGASTTFTIKASGDNLQLKWRKGGKDLHESSKYRGTKTHTLYIKDVEKSDKGSYQCIVKNDVGELSEEASLAVIDTPKITQHPESKSVATGASATFTIKASGDNLQLKWRKGGKDLHESSKYRGTKTHTLYIKDVEKSDKGSYQCIVKNDVGELSEEADLAVSYNWTQLISMVVLVFLVAVIGIWWLLHSVAVDCGTLPDPANGRVSHTTGTTFGQTATYSCNPGYNLMGDITRMCQATGVWSGSEPTCQHEVRPPVSAAVKAEQLGVQFIDPVETIPCDTHGCNYYNDRHDVKLRIPEGAIPPSEGMVDIEFGVAMYGPFKLSDGRSVRRVSPVVWLCIQQDGFSGFQKDLEITIPHFLQLSTEDAYKYLRFLKADHELDVINEDGKIQYQLKPAAGTAVFDHANDATHGKLLTRHFCSVCIATSVLRNEHTRYYLGGGRSLTAQDGQIIFYICYFLPSCVRTVQQQLNKLESKIYPTEFMFTDGRELKINHNEVPDWVLATESSNKISAEQVDFQGMSEDDLKLREDEMLYPPMFVIKVRGSSSAENSKVIFTFEGATEKIVKEVILTKDQSVVTHSPDNGRSPPKLDNPPKLPILRHFPGKDGPIDIVEKIATDYKHFGTQLLNDDGGAKVRIIEMKMKHGNPIDITVEILEHWLQGKGRMPVTWQTLVKCLQELNLHVLASSIENMLSMNSVTSDRDHSEL